MTTSVNNADFDLLAAEKAVPTAGKSSPLDNEENSGHHDSSRNVGDNDTGKKVKSEKECRTTIESSKLVCLLASIVMMWLTSGK